MTATDAQDEFDSSPELQATLREALASPTVHRTRRSAVAGQDSVDLVALVADLIPRPLPHNVGDWPEEDRDYYRSYPGSFTDSTEALDRMRRERAARAILAALGIETLTDERDRLAAAVDSLAVTNPTEQDRRRFKVNHGVLYAYVRAYERSKAYGLAGDLASGASSGEAAANRLWRRAEQERPNA